METGPRDEKPRVSGLVRFALRPVLSAKASDDEVFSGMDMPPGKHVDGEAVPFATPFSLL